MILMTKNGPIIISQPTHSTAPVEHTSQSPQVEPLWLSWTMFGLIMLVVVFLSVMMFLVVKEGFEK